LPSSTFVLLSQLFKKLIIVKYTAGSLCFDVQPSEGWFPSGHACECYLVHKYFQNFHHKISFGLVQTSNQFTQKTYMLQVFEIAKAIGWVPPVADRNKTYLHLNHRIPKELKFDLNCLLYTHGKLCRKCTKKSGSQQRKETHDDSCPLLNYCVKLSWPEWTK